MMGCMMMMGGWPGMLAGGLVFLLLLVLLVLGVAALIKYLRS
jgi:hypothetical protein